MNRWVKRATVAITVVVALAGVAATAGLVMAHQRMNRTVQVDGRAVPIPDDAAAIERGAYLFASRGCADCHGANGAGRMFLDTPDGLRVRGANLTAGTNSATRGYRPGDWDLAIRHGLSPTGRPLMIMPSEDYNRLTDADLGALVAYIRSLPATEGAPALVELPQVPRLAYGFGVMRDAAAKIDHTLPPETAVPEGLTLEHGRYVANACRGCHGLTLAGGPIPGAPPEWPPAPALVGGTSIIASRYPDAASFARMFKRGQRPNGTTVQVMPFESLRQMNETDVAALHLYLAQGAGGDRR